ncbi:MAG: hypothetical protein PF637_10605 [Spirochaetes bacterium]|jgi:hypothetical protein|nr:hypothetical protein [Spirochaetota bacterium]
MLFHRYFKRCLQASFFFILFAIISCTRQVYFKQDIVPAKSLYSTNDSVAVTHSLLCELTVEYLDVQKWSRLTGNRPYGSLLSFSATPFPWYPFLVTIRNSSSQIIEPGNIVLKGGQLENPALTSSQIQRIKSSISISDVELFTGNRLYHDFNKKYDQMNLSRETTVYEFEKILPGDRVLFLVIFNRLPSHISEFTFSVDIVGENDKKTVEVPLRHREYRVYEDRL